MANFLTESGADVGATSVFGAAPLHWVAYMGLCEPKAPEYVLFQPSDKRWILFLIDNPRLSHAVLNWSTSAAFTANAIAAGTSDG